jgi:hypothetical protein
MSTLADEIPWWAVHTNLSILVKYMGEEENADIAQIVHALEKPWHYEDEWARAQAWAVAQ